MSYILLTAFLSLKTQAFGPDGSGFIEGFHFKLSTILSHIKKYSEFRSSTDNCNVFIYKPRSHKNKILVCSYEQDDKVVLSFSSNHYSLKLLTSSNGDEYQIEKLKLLNIKGSFLNSILLNPIGISLSYSNESFLLDFRPWKYVARILSNQNVINYFLHCPWDCPRSASIQKVDGRVVYSFKNFRDTTAARFFEYYQNNLGFFEETLAEHLQTEFSRLGLQLDR